MNNFNIYIRSLSFFLCLLFLNPGIGYTASDKKEVTDDRRQTIVTNTESEFLADFVLPFYHNMHNDNDPEGEPEQKEESKEPEVEDEKEENKVISDLYHSNCSFCEKNLLLFNRHLNGNFNADILVPPPKS